MRMPAGLADLAGRMVVVMMIVRAMTMVMRAVSVRMMIVRIMVVTVMAMRLKRVGMRRMSMRGMGVTCGRVARMRMAGMGGRQAVGRACAEQAKHGGAGLAPQKPGAEQGDEHITHRFEEPSRVGKVPGRRCRRRAGSLQARASACAGGLSVPAGRQSAARTRCAWRRHRSPESRDRGTARTGSPSPIPGCDPRGAARRR